MAKRLGISVSTSFIDLDFLLNTKQYRRASCILAAIRMTLSAIYVEQMQLNKDLVSAKLVESLDKLTPYNLTPSYSIN